MNPERQPTPREAWEAVIFIIGMLSVLGVILWNMA